MMGAEPQRIATFASSLIGDTLMATSLYQALRLRYPTEITLLSELPDHPVLSGLNAFDVVQKYSPSCDLTKFDLVVLPVFCGDKKVRSHFDQHPRVVSLDRLHERERGSFRNGFDGFYTHLLFYKHQVELNEDLAREFGFTDVMPPLYCPQGEPTQYNHLKDRVGLFINTPQNVFQALPNRQWPLTHWKALIELMGPSNVVLVGAASDLPNLELLAKETCVPYEAATTLADFTALCGNLKVLVTTDGGGMHAAATTGVPIVSLHGTSSPILLHPWIYPNGKCIAIQAPNTCSPCQRSYRLRLCEIGRTQMCCMERIKPEQVIESIDLLGSQEKGTCMILKGDKLQSKVDFIRSPRRKAWFMANYNLSRISLTVR